MSYTADPATFNHRPRMSKLTGSLVTALVAGRVVDVTMSVAAFAHGAGELNPIARYAWGSFGTVGLVTYEALGLAIILAAVAILPVGKRLALTAVGITSWLPVLLNTALMNGWITL